MSNTTFNRIVLGIFVALVGLLFAVNIVIDPYGVLGTSGFSDGPSSNERYLKIETLRRSKESYELLMFASSRSGMTDPKWIEEITGMRSYNLSVFSAKPSDMRKLYAAYRKTRAAPKQVLIGIDAMAFLLEPEERDLSRRHHPTIEKAGPASYWLDYLLAPSLLPAMEKVSGAKQPAITFDWSKGTYRLDKYEREISSDHQAYMDRTFTQWQGRQFTSRMDTREWRQLTEWLDVLKKDKVEVRIFVQPMHRQWKGRMKALMTELAPLLNSIEGIVDLTDLRSDDDSVWYEQRHYREPVARTVVSKLFGDSALLIAEGSRRAAESR